MATSPVVLIIDGDDSHRTYYSHRLARGISGYPRSVQPEEGELNSSTLAPIKAARSRIE